MFSPAPGNRDGRKSAVAKCAGTQYIRASRTGAPDTGEENVVGRLRMLRKAFLGGTFDPPHYGHLAQAEAALSLRVTDRVLMAPAFAPPHKNGLAFASYEDRVRMLRLLTDGKPDIEVCEVERELAMLPSYTYEVMEKLAARDGGCRLQLLIGGDSLAQLHTWHRGRELAERWEVITYPRKGVTPDLDFLRRRWPERLAEKLADGILDAPFFEISSTELRKLMAIGGKLDNFIPETIRDYVKLHRIYCGFVQGGAGGI